MNSIIIKGAREHNLKNIDLTLPRNKLICFVGVSGSGKSTLAFDIIAREGQRQYFESLSSYARRYLQKSNRPLIDDIKGISSSVIISQDRIHPSPRSTVGTVTEAYTYLRMLYSRCGLPSYDSSYFSFNHPLGACPRCKGLGRAMDIDLTQLVDLSKSLNEGAILYSNWCVGSMMWKIIRATNYFDMNLKLGNFPKADLDRLLYSQKEVAPNNDGVIKWTFKGIVTHLMSRGCSAHRHVNAEEAKYFTYIDCPECHGGRLKPSSLAVKLNGLNIGEVGNLPITKALAFIKSFDHRNAVVIQPRLVEQLQHLVTAGVGYLSLNRSTDTLSGGEAQRVKVARQLGCDLIETIYVLDEPTVGMHPQDIEKVIANLIRLRDTGNTVIVVEHDPDVIRAADHIVEVGPGGGKRGGEIVFSGPYKEFMKSETSLTARCLRDSPREGLSPHHTPTGSLTIRTATRHNLKQVTVDVPTGVLVCVTGVSGAGKSSLVEEFVAQHPGNTVIVDQRRIGSHKRGCVATYVGAFDEIRRVFGQATKTSISQFSFNSAGACKDCKGLGFVDMDMNFLGSIRIPCETCGGRRYMPQVLKLTYHNKNIADVLEMTVEEAYQFFDLPVIRKPIGLLLEVGLDYIEIGQSLDTLSGGESQRLKLASRLGNRGTVFVLDEPTTGMHFADIDKLLKLIRRLVTNGNTVLVIEHNLQIIRQADWIIELGPGGGDEGGRVIAEGTPEGLAKSTTSVTGRYL